MKITIENGGGVTVAGASLCMISSDLIMLMVTTKEKYPEFMHGKSYSGAGICNALLVTFFDDAFSVVTLEPENNWEREFIQECEHYQGSDRYGPEILYIRHANEYLVIGCADK